jgi:signal transduction histidine kinase
MVIVASFSTLLFFAAGVNTARTRFKEVRFFIFGGIGVIVAAAFISGRTQLGIDIPIGTALDAMRISIVYDAMMMGLALVDRYLQTRREQRLVLEESLATARRNLEMRERLDRLEQRYALMHEVAQKRGQRLSDATHDLRSPIHALRLILQQLIDSGNVEGKLGKSISQSFEYLENLVENTLAESVSDSLEPAPAVAAKTLRRDASAFPAQLVLQNAQEMFADEAKRKGLRLTSVPCSLDVLADPLELMRILSNLVSNAVKFTPKGRVLLGCRRRRGRLSIEVHDTGPGMTPAEAGAMMERSVRKGDDGAQQDGYGLGLAIVNDLAHRGGFRVSCDSVPGRGTRFSVEVPCAPTSEITGNRSPVP